MSNNLITLAYIQKTSKVINTLRFGQSYDDQTGLMISNKMILIMLACSGYNFRTMNSYSVMKLLSVSILGLENILPESVDCDSIKYTVLQLIS